MISKSKLPNEKWIIKMSRGRKMILKLYQLSYFGEDYLSDEK